MYGPATGTLQYLNDLLHCLGLHILRGHIDLVEEKMNSDIHKCQRVNDRPS